MGIKYFIFQTRLQGESKFFGRVILKGTIDQAGMIGRMLDMGSSLTKPDITAVLQLLSMAIEKACSEGYKVNLDGLVQVTPVMGGEFADKSDSFLSPRNSLYLTSQVSRGLNDRLSQNASVERVIVDETRPEEYLRLVNAHNPSEFLPVSRFHKVSDQELVFRLPQAPFSEGYFELATSLNTTSIRVGRSSPFQMAA